MFIIILTRAFYWQIIKCNEYREKSLNQTYKLVKRSPIRGNIYTSDDFPLVLNQYQYLMSIYKPNLTEELPVVLNKIKQIVPDFIASSSASLDKFTNNSNQKWITLTTPIDESLISQINFPGITFDFKMSRYYPENNLAKNLIPQLEAYYQKSLEGKTSYSYVTKDAIGKIVLSRKSWENEAQNGQDLKTNINRTIQYIVEKELQNGIDRYGASSGMISIIEPATGAILAMTSLSASPSASSSAQFRNAPILDLFEPGSIFKPLVVAMALDSKSINLDYICQKCNSPHTIGQYTITNHDDALHPDSNLQDIIKNSDNIGMSYVIEQIGLKKFLEYFNKLGLTRKTGIDLQGEAHPMQKNYWAPIDLATASFGQGFAVTQIQMLSSFNVLANNGQLIRPQIASTKKYSSEIVFSPETIKNIKSILQYGVENGVVNQFRPKNLQVCAKSGTAQIAIGGKYADSSTIASYIGFSPCNNPKFTMIVTINNPTTSPWGSSTAAPIWFNLAEKISNLL